VWSSGPHSPSPILIVTPDDHLYYQEWDEKKWIGVGKKYPVSGEVPTFIEAARSKVLAVPPIYSSYIPNPKMSTVPSRIIQPSRVTGHLDVAEIGHLSQVTRRVATVKNK
jgi:hypothetical protein